MPSRKLKVLLIDDDAVVAELLGAVLRHEGFELKILLEPLRLEESLAAFEPDIVVSDFHMPERDGLNVLAAVHALRPRAARVMFSGELAIDPRRLAAVAPVVVFAKDVDPRLLVVRLREAASNR